MKEILGNNLKQFFPVLDNPKEYGAICTYKSNRYEVWLMDDEIFDMIADISEEKFVKFAGEDAWCIRRHPVAAFAAVSGHGAKRVASFLNQ